MLWLKSRKDNLVGREDVAQFFNMYRGKQNKLIINEPSFRVAHLGKFLYIQVTPIVNTSIVFLEHEEGTEIVVLDHLDKIINRVINPFISPSSILSKGRLVVEDKQEEYSRHLQEEIEVEVFIQSVYDNMTGEVEKIRYIHNTWNMSKTLVYDLVR